MIMKLLKSISNFCILIALTVWFGVACTSNTSDESVEEGNMEIDEAKELEMKNQLDLVLAKKKNWYTHWSKLIGPFDSDNFKMVMSDSIDPQEMPEKNPILKGDPLFPYQFVHPTANGTIDIYSYKIEAQEAIDTPYLNPDSEVIWYRADGMKERLLFMGPSGMFEEGEWINENQFVVLGYFQEESGFRPMAWFIDVNEHRIWQFNLAATATTYEQDSYLDQKIKQVALN
jgi:hypothetical protein